jgi:hypothetical protein
MSIESVVTITVSSWWGDELKLLLPMKHYRSDADIVDVFTKITQFLDVPPDRANNILREIDNKRRQKCQKNLK